MPKEVVLDTNPIIGKIRELGMSQQEFADKDGRSLTAVRKIFSGQTDLSWKTIMKWSKILGVQSGSAEWYRLFFSTKTC